MTFKSYKDANWLFSFKKKENAQRSNKICLVLFWKKIIIFIWRPQGISAQESGFKETRLAGSSNW